MFEIIDSGRHKSALSGDLTPLSIDIENKCGKFVGSEGYIYDTSLEHCTCADFAIHGGTMPEDLPTPDKSIKQIEHERKNQLKKK